MDRQKYLEMIAERLRERGILDSELERPLGDFEQYLIENESDELYESLDDPEELEDLVENFHQMILKRREILRRRRLERERNAAIPTQPEPQPQPEIVPEPPTEIEPPQAQFEDDSDMKLAVAVKRDREIPPEADIYGEMMQHTDAEDAQPISFAEPQEDLSATTTIDRAQLREAQSRQNINLDNSATRTMDAITPEQLSSLGQIYSQNAQTQSEIPNEQSQGEPPMPPVNLNEPPRKMTRSEKRHESLHMYEDLPPLSRDDEEYGQIDPNAFEAEMPYGPPSAKSSALFWVLFILTLPLTVPIIAAFGLVFVAVFIVMAVLIVGFLATLVVDVVVGTALSLIGIIYGITQTFTIVPIGLYEIGLGIVVGGAAMLVGILIYNAAVRLLPFLCRKWYEFFCFVMGQIKRLFNYLRRETAKK